MQAKTETILAYCKKTGIFPDEIVGATEEELQEALYPDLTKCGACGLNYDDCECG